MTNERLRQHRAVRVRRRTFLEKYGIHILLVIAITMGFMWPWKVIEVSNMLDGKQWIVRIDTVGHPEDTPRFPDR